MRVEVARPTGRWTQLRTLLRSLSVTLGFDLCSASLGRRYGTLEGNRERKVTYTEKKISRTGDANGLTLLLISVEW